MQLAQPWSTVKIAAFFIATCSLYIPFSRIVLASARDLGRFGFERPGVAQVFALMWGTGAVIVLAIVYTLSSAGFPEFAIGIGLGAGPIATLGPILEAVLARSRRDHDNRIMSAALQETSNLRPFQMRPGALPVPNGKPNAS